MPGRVVTYGRNRRGVVNYGRGNYYRPLARVAGYAARYAYRTYSQRRASTYNRANQSRKRKRYRGAQGKRMRRTKKKKGFSKRLNIVERKLVDGKTVLRYKGNDTQFIYTFDGNTENTNITAWDRNTLQAVIAQMRFYDATTNSYLQKDPELKSTRLKFTNIMSKMTLKNNYTVPVNVAVYVCRVNSDDANTPSVAFGNAVADQVTFITNPAATAAESNHIYPSELSMFKKQWKIIQTKKRMLLNGQSMNVSAMLKDLTYSADWFDEFTIIDSRKIKATTFFVRVTGVLGHENVTPISKVGSVEGSVDVQTKFYATMRYNGGGPGITYTVIDDQSTLVAADQGAAGTVMNGPVKVYDGIK